MTCRLIESRTQCGRMVGRRPDEGVFVGTAALSRNPGVATMNEAIIPIRRALISVFNKQGLIDLARALAATGTELLASGGTRSALAASGFAVIEVADYTGQPEVFGGRAKTLHPNIHRGILSRRARPTP